MVFADGFCGCFSPPLLLIVGLSLSIYSGGRLVSLAAYVPATSPQGYDLFFRQHVTFHFPPPLFPCLGTSLTSYYDQTTAPLYAQRMKVFMRGSVSLPLLPPPAVCFKRSTFTENPLPTSNTCQKPRISGERLTLTSVPARLSLPVC